VLIAFFACLIGLVRITIHTLPANPALTLLSPDPTCPQPCWHGIQLGKTTVDEAQAHLLNDKVLASTVTRRDALTLNWSIPPGAIYPSQAWSPLEQSQIQDIVLGVPPTTHLRLGDAIALWGDPTHANVERCNGGDAYHGQAHLDFQGNIEVMIEFYAAWDQPEPPGVQLSPETPIAEIHYFLDPSRRFWYRDPTYSGFTFTGFRYWTQDQMGYSSMCGL
jgi:hypothetical protein